MSQEDGPRHPTVWYSRLELRIILTYKLLYLRFDTRTGSQSALFYAHGLRGAAAVMMALSLVRSAGRRTAGSQHIK